MHNIDNKLTVMVTGIGGGGNGEQILKALRLTNRYKIIGGDMSPMSKGLMETDASYLLPPATDDCYIDSVLAVCKKEKVKALFYGSEPELKAMSMHRDKIRNAGIFLPINPKKVIEICMDKVKTSAFLHNLGFNTPKSFAINSEEDLAKIDFFPVVLKPSVGGGASANTMLAQSPKEVGMFGRYLLGIYSEFIIQEYVGTPYSEFTVGVLHSMDGELINSIAVNRSITSSLGNRLKVLNKTGRKELGETLAISSGISQGQIGRFPSVTEPCEKIAKSLGACGAINIQCRLVDDKVYVFEVNPRFSGTTSLRAMVGYNEPDILIRHHLMGEPFESHFEYSSGFITRGLEEVLIKDVNFCKANSLL